MSSSESESSDDELPVTFKRKSPLDDPIDNKEKETKKRMQSVEMAELADSRRVEVVETTVDDTDGIDDALEYELWKKREINRVKREYAQLKELDERAQQAHRRSNKQH